MRAESVLGRSSTYFAVASDRDVSRVGLGLPAHDLVQLDEHARLVGLKAELLGLSAWRVGEDGLVVELAVFALLELVSIGLVGGAFDGVDEIAVLLGVL